MKKRIFELWLGENYLTGLCMEVNSTIAEIKQHALEVSECIDREIIPYIKSARVMIRTTQGNKIEYKPEVTFGNS